MYNLAPIKINTAHSNAQNMHHTASQLGANVRMPNHQRNYCIFNKPLVDALVKSGEKAIPPVLNVLSRSQNEKQIAEGIYVLDRMIDAGVKGVEKSYPVLSRFNRTPSPTVQALLSGVYRKTQVPDAFGPLCSMLIRNSLTTTCPYFDPTEEIGGAILDYIRNKGAVAVYESQKTT